MVWDLSRSVPMVFRSPGNTLINLFHLLFNSKCHFFKIICLLNCLLYCLFYCLLYCLLYCCVSSRVLGRPGPGTDRLGLKCYLAWGGTRVVWGGGGGGNFFKLKSTLAKIANIFKNVPLFIGIRLFNFWTPKLLTNKKYLPGSS